ncbi:hypothetical protein AB1Y20_004213 [Prymnesium parvum]|uniref:Chromo domain-containing protein n=1 Tax=Prymnesium parvum TaxID=97485 RepID=A0AB34J6S9_PRYPA
MLGIENESKPSRHSSTPQLVMPSEPSPPLGAKYVSDKPLNSSPLSTIDDTVLPAEHDAAVALPVDISHVQASESASETASEPPADSAACRSLPNSLPLRASREVAGPSSEGGAGGTSAQQLAPSDDDAALASSRALLFGDTSAIGEEEIEAMLDEAPVGIVYERIRLKGQGFADETFDANVEIRSAIRTLAALLDSEPELELKAAESETELLEALKLYRDMNHLSLAGGITCEHVVAHVHSHTVLLYFRSSPDAAPIPVTAATFSMRQHAMMLRLLATHPRMTRKGFGRVTVHFLKELCRALQKTEIIVYTYPSSSSFYKALHFAHTHPQHAETARPALASATADEQSREAARDARRVFSAKENEMIFYCQQTMEQVLLRGYKSGQSGVLHPYACTRRQHGALPSERAQGGGREAGGVAARREPPAEARGGGRGGRGARRGRPCSRPAAPSHAPPAAAPPAAAPPAEAAPPAVLDGARAAWFSAVAPMLPSKRLKGEELPQPAVEGSAQGAVLAGEEPAEQDAPPRAASPRKRTRVGKTEYQVEKILQMRRVEEEVQYLIKWKGWAAKYNTWEPLSHLQNLQLDIASFHALEQASGVQ